MTPGVSVGTGMRARAGLEVARRTAPWLAPRWRTRWIAVAALLAAAWLGQRPSPTTVVAVWSALGLAALLRWRPLGLPALLAAIAFVPFSLGTGTQSRVNVAMLGIAGLSGLAGVDMFLGRRVGLRPSEANRPWIALAVVGGVSIVVGHALWDARVVTSRNFPLVQMAQWSVYILAACAFWLCANWPRDRRELRAVTGLMLALGLLFLASRTLPGSWHIGNRLLLQGPVTLIWFAALALAMALFHVGLARRWRVAAALLGAAVVWVPFAQTRSWASGWLPSLTTVGLLVGLWQWRSGHRMRVAAGGLGAVGVALAAYVVPGAVVADRWSLETRMVAWRGLWALLDDRWLIGLGLASYWHYWRGVLGSIAYLDRMTGHLHYSYDPKVNMHNNYLDIVGQMGVVGAVVFAWLAWSILRQAWRVFCSEPPGFGKAYAAAAIGAFGGMLFAGLLGDWILPFVYNIGLSGFADAAVGWLLLGGIVLLDATRSAPGDGDSPGSAPPTRAPAGPGPVGAPVDAPARGTLAEGRP